MDIFNITFDCLAIGLLLYLFIINPFVERYIIRKHEKNGEIYMYNDKIRKWGWFKKEKL